MTTPGYQVADVPAQWPVASSAEKYQGRIVSVRVDTIRSPDGTPPSARWSRTPAQWAWWPWTSPGRRRGSDDQAVPASGRALLWNCRPGCGCRRRAAAAHRAPELLEETGYRAACWTCWWTTSARGHNHGAAARLPGPRPGARARIRADFVPENEEPTCWSTGCRWTRRSAWPWLVSCIMALR